MMINARELLIDSLVASCLALAALRSLLPHRRQTEYCSCLPPASPSSTWEHLRTGGALGEGRFGAGVLKGRIWLDWGIREAWGGVAVAGDTVQQHGEIIAATLCSSTRDGRFFFLSPLLTSHSPLWPGLAD
ncbi:hypothetical protein E2C01_014729 [Portunus trituberculatus]|uniref:Secreted protein n=1 Tax=Portunus trituberculatus TaxID=210409 RepID=A0A5B7DL37_PORTR|nr:hypothetical protein [Portunus trituberculatus]